MPTSAFILTLLSRLVLRLVMGLAGAGLGWLKLAGAGCLAEGGCATNFNTLPCDDADPWSWSSCTDHEPEPFCGGSGYSESPTPDMVSDDPQLHIVGVYQPDPIDSPIYIENDHPGEIYLVLIGKSDGDAFGVECQIVIDRIISLAITKMTDNDAAVF